MNRVLSPGPRTGRVTVPGSKSRAHRLFLAAALGRTPVQLTCRGLSGDLLATLSCLEALGAQVENLKGDRLTLVPLSAPPTGEILLPCGESGTTLRFLLPLVGALGAEAVFQRRGRLPRRPLEPLLAELTRHGMTIRAQGDDLLVQGQLTPGDYALPGHISSQFISGLLLALPLLPGHSTLTLTSPPQSAPYIALTEQVLRQGGVTLHRGENAYAIPGGQGYALPSPQVVEGDWSAAAPFLCAGALSPAGVTVTGLTLPSLQGDSVLPALLEKMGAEVETSPQSVTVRARTLRAITVDAGPIPDLIPPLCALCAVARGESRIRNAQRLRDKESDRLQGVAELLNGLGGKLTVDGDDLRIFGVPRLQGGTADPRRDHRLAMTAAVAASACTGPVTVLDSDCVQKSYPAFWADYGQMTISR